MIGVVLSLLTAAGFGLSDFVAGVASRRGGSWAVAVGAQVASACAVALVALARPGDPTWVDLAWGVVAGVGNGVGTAFLYRGLASGRMGVVAPVSAVGAAVLPVAVAVVVGERPGVLVWAGVAAAFPGIWLVSREADRPVRGRRVGVAGPLTDGVIAGLGFGLVFTGLGQVGDAAGFVPLALDQAVSCLLIVALACGAGAPLRPRGGAAVGAVAAGAAGGASIFAYQLAAQAGSLTVAAVVSSLYPAVTIVLASVVLREHIHRVQGVGLVLCAVTVGLVAAG